MHRDLKTENVLLDAEGHIKLTDFGVSKGSLDTEERGRSMTMIHGTTEYMAPEIFESSSGYGFSVDWYSLGLIIFEMLSGGEHPYKNHELLDENDYQVKVMEMIVK